MPHRPFETILPMQTCTFQRYFFAGPSVANAGGNRLLTGSFIQYRIKTPHPKWQKKAPLAAALIWQFGNRGQPVFIDAS
jgi:hypothetical protein